MLIIVYNYKKFIVVIYLAHVGRASIEGAAMMKIVMRKDSKFSLIVNVARICVDLSEAIIYC